MNCELLYLAHNRLEFTRESFSTMVANTDWSRVAKLHVYDDASTDGTAEYLVGAAEAAPVETAVVRGRWGSSVTPLRDFLRASEAEIVGKIDNDTMLPPGWLERSLAVLGLAPELDLLGIDTFTRPGEPVGYLPARHIGGIGLFRRRAFSSLPAADKRYFGFTKWQTDRKGCAKGWIRPPLPVFLLDLIPFDPWRSLSKRYIQQGVQRRWPPYNGGSTWLWEWWTSRA